EAIARRFEIALRVLDESMHLSQYVLKRHHVLTPHASHVDPAVEALLSARDHHLEIRRASAYTLTPYFVILAEADANVQAWSSRVRQSLAAPFRMLRAQLSTKRSCVLLDEELETLRQRLLHRVTAFTAQLQDTIKP